MADSTVSIGADLSELRRELAKLPNLSTDAAQKTLIQIEKAVQKAEKAAKKSSKDIARANKAAAKAAEAANRAADDSLKDMGETAGDTESSIRAISGALGMISPEAEQAMNVVAELGGGFEGLTKATGLLGGSATSLATAAGVAAVAVAGIATVAVVVANSTYEARAEMTGYMDAINAADRASRNLIQSQSALSIGMDASAGILASQQQDYALVTGEINAQDVALAKSADTINEKLNPALNKAKDAWVANRTSIDSLKASIESGRLGVTARLEAELDLQAALKETGGINASIAALKEEKVVLKESAQAHSEKTEAFKAAQVEATKVTKMATKATKDDTTAEDDLAEAARAKAEAAIAAAAVVSGLTKHRLSEIEALAVAEEDAMAKLLETEVATQEQIQAIREEFALRREELYQKETDLRKELSDKSTAELIANEAALEKAAISSASAKLATVATVSGGISELADMVSSNQINADEKTSKRQRALALRAFKVSKALSLSQTAVLTAQALMVAMATVGTPQRIAAVAAATVTGAVSLAKIAGTNPPTFHTGGVVAAKPGEVGITAQAGEAVLSREMVAQNGGPDEVMQRAAEGFGAQSVTVDFKLRHRSLDKITTEVMRAGGAASEATRGLRPSGFSNPYTASR